MPLGMVREHEFPATKRDNSCKTEQNIFFIYTRVFTGIRGYKTIYTRQHNKASQAIQSLHTVQFFLLISLLDGYSFANVHVKGIVAFKH